jgi:hypothetical protein
MPETITHHSDGTATWRWHDMVRDLEQQGGLTDVIIDPFSVGPNSCMGEHKGNHFAVSWKKDALLMLTMFTYSEPLVEAFAEVVGYSPFCRYSQRIGSYDLAVVEWAKNDAEDRFAELQRNVTPGLTRILNV